MNRQHQRNYDDEQKRKVCRQRREQISARLDCISQSDDDDDDNSNNNNNMKPLYQRSSFESADNFTTTDEDGSAAAAPTDEEQSLTYPQTTASSAASVLTDEDDEYRMHKPYSTPFGDTPTLEKPPSSSAPNQQYKTPPRYQPHPALNNNNINNTSQGETGGRLWRLAGEIAAGKAPSPLLGKSPNTQANLGQLRESFLERMRSRADPDALVTPPTPPRPDPRSSQVMIVKMTDSFSDENHQEEEAFLINTGLAHKRVRVVQLLIIGLMGLLLGWLGNFFVSSSCYFASVPVPVGQNGDTFALHFGLWNYSPADSALNGFKYCYPYGGQHEGDAPVVSRAFNLAALLAGTYSLVVLWWYLISGRVNAKFWKAAVYSAIAAGALQFATPIFFFAGSMCRASSCSAGPGSALSAVTAVAWVVLGAELHYQCPVMDVNPNCGPPSRSLPKGDRMNGAESSTPVANLEMADLAGASQEYLDRFQRKRLNGRYMPPELA